MLGKLVVSHVASTSVHPTDDGEEGEADESLVTSFNSLKIACISERIS